ncbi:unnamed protein product [Symbiodinium natans]|uniref:Uncharacterized protein n=1 Tax=Symbiodinium natans TaxID=878477 RepID=A0A812TPP3_9DINO|nr:unnamed protein product [Symbiodinium natans]
MATPVTPASEAQESSPYSWAERWDASPSAQDRIRRCNLLRVLLVWRQDMLLPAQVHSPAVYESSSRNSTLTDPIQMAPITYGTGGAAPATWQPPAMPSYGWQKPPGAAWGWPQWGAAATGPVHGVPGGLLSHQRLAGMQQRPPEQQRAMAGSTPQVGLAAWQQLEQAAIQGKV